MKYNKSFERDYNFYLDCVSNNNFMFAGEDVKYKNFSIDGVDAKEAFYNIDTYGKFPNCQEPVLAAFLLTAKKGLNLQIKQWALGMAEFTLIPFELKKWLEEYETPPWVYKSVINQARKMCKVEIDLEILNILIEGSE